MRELFELRGSLTNKQRITLGILGGVFLLVVWCGASYFGLVRKSILPMPTDVLGAFPELFGKDRLLMHARYSTLLNVVGYFEAILIALPVGFAIGLVPLLRGLFLPYISALRYLPLSATMGLFILAFGIATNMKIQFLTMAALVYLVPQVVGRIDEVEEIYLQTVQTLGATKWQRVRYVFMPLVISRLFSDLVVLFGISWTYIIIAEVVNTSDGGLGALAIAYARASRTDKVYAVLIVILLIGFAADKIGKGIDRLIFRYKYA